MRNILILLVSAMMMVTGICTVTFADPPSLARVRIRAGGSSTVDDTALFNNIFVNIPVSAMGNMPAEFPHASAAHSYAIDSSESHWRGESIKSNYFVGLEPWWSGMFMILGGGADGWTAEETDFSAYSSLSFWVKAASDSNNPKEFKLEIVDHDGISSTQITGITTSWNKHTVSLSSVAGLDKSRVKQINIVYENGVIETVGGSFSGIVYVDEFKME